MGRKWSGFVAATTFAGVLVSAQSPVRVVVGQRVATDVPGQGGHEYRVSLRAGQFVHVVVNQLGIDVVVTATGPAGETLVQMDSPNGANGPEEVRLIAEKDGDYGLAIRASRSDARGRYELEVVALRTPTGEDRRRLSIQEALLTASRLGPRSDDVTRVAAVQKLREAAAMARALKDTAALLAINEQLVGLDPKAMLEDSGVSRLPGPLPVYASRGLTQRANALRERLIPAIAFFEARLGVKSTVHLAVLNRRDWEKLSTVPYGVPWSNQTPTGAESIVCAPATLDVFDGFTKSMNRGKGWSSEALQALNATGLSFEQGMREAADDLLYHELGHIYTVAYGIGPPNMWFNEFLANYLMEAYLAEAAPRSRVFGVARRDWFITLEPRYTSLDDLERLYIAVGVENYGWYQSHFERRVVSVYQAQGFDFLRRVKATFPAGSAPAPVPDVLDRLESISPGFMEWAKGLTNGPSAQ